MLVHLVWMDDVVREVPPVDVVRMDYLEPLVIPDLEPQVLTETPVEMVNLVSLDVED